MPASYFFAVVSEYFVHINSMGEGGNTDNRPVMTVNII